MLVQTTINVTSTEAISVSPTNAFGENLTPEAAKAMIVTRKTRTPAMIPRLRTGTPAATSSIPIAKQITRAVPMSGCLSSSAQAAPTTSSSGLTSPPIVLVVRGRAASSWAA